MKRISVVLPPVWSVVYMNVARLLKYTLKDLHFHTEIRPWGCHHSDELNIVLGWNLLQPCTTIKGNYILYQLEPMNQPLWQDKYNTHNSLFNQASAIWDYSSLNVSLLENMHTNVHHLPLGFHEKMMDVKPTPFSDFDVLFTGSKTRRRLKILSDLHKYCGVSTGQKWGRDLTEAIRRSKILLNIHQYSIPTPLEQVRLSYAMNNQCLVISESSSANPYPWLQTYHIDQIVPEVIKLLYNPLTREQKQQSQFYHFSQFKMKTPLSRILNKIILPEIRLLKKMQ